MASHKPSQAVTDSLLHIYAGMSGVYTKELIRLEQVLEAGSISIPEYELCVNSIAQSMAWLQNERQVLSNLYPKPEQP